MDRCNYCKEYHAPFDVCDGYIRWLETSPKPTKGAPDLIAFDENGSPIEINLRKPRVDNFRQREGK